MKFDPGVALRYLEILRSGGRDQAQAGVPLVAEIRRLDRPARARGITNIVTTALLGGAATQTLLMANPNRRMFSVISNSGNTNIGPASIPVSSSVGYQVSNTSAPTVFKEEDWGALVQLEWSFFNAALMGTAVFLFEEIYIK